MDNDKLPENNQESLESLETLETDTNSPIDGPEKGPASANIDASSSKSEATKPKSKSKHKNTLKHLGARFNIYLLLFFILLGGVITGLYLFYGADQEKDAAESISQELTEEAIEQLKQSDVRIGDPRFTLGIESDTVFAGGVLISDDLDVAGSLQLGGGLSITELTASGQSTFDQVQANGLAIAQNASIQGQLIVQGSLNVTGGGSFGAPISAPSITVNNLELNDNLRVNRHITTGGSSPSRSNGNALGGGGTTSVSGTDTAGTAVINIGSSPGAGCYINISFSRNFNRTPSVIISPASSAAGGMNYYANRSNSGFSICASSAPAGGQSYVFDYIVIE